MADIPATCKAAALVGINMPMEIIDVKVPDTLEHGAILVKSTAATICASDVHAWQGESATAPEGLFPRILGHEMTGRIVRLGSGVTHDSVGEPLQEGDRIIWSHGFCGQCYYCAIEHEPTLCTNRRGYMSSRCTEYPYLVGGFGEYCYVFPTSGRVKVPDEIPDEMASAAACALRTVVHGFDRLGRIEDRHTVAIQGTGPLGLFSVALAVRAGASKVIAIGGPPHRLEIARRWGATHTLDVGETRDPQERHQRIMDWTGGQGPDIAVEVSGATTAFPEGLDMLRKGGRYLIIGQIGDHEVTLKPGDLVRKHIRLIGNMSASLEHYYKALQFLKNNWDRFTFMDMISNHYPLQRINEAMERMSTWEEVKPAISFTA
jgi:L-iditol 2-dehydrogenase